MKASREALVSLEAQGFNGVETALVTPDRNQRVANGGAIPAVQPPLPVTEDEVIATLDLALDGNWLLGAKYATGNRNSTRGLELRLLVPLRIGAAGETEFARVNGLEGDETRGLWAYEVEEIFDRSIDSTENSDPLFAKLKFFKAGKFILIKPYMKVFGLENVVLCLQSRIRRFITCIHA